VKNLEIRFALDCSDISHVSALGTAYVPCFYQQLKLMFPNVNRTRIRGGSSQVIK
ncbi:hypothetical protein GGH91_004873, partial [Coemansia sp. RSA 2671]